MLSIRVASLQNAVAHRRRIVCDLANGQRGYKDILTLNLKEIDVHEQAYERVEALWKKWHIWDEQWTSIPGRYWGHEKRAPNRVASEHAASDVSVLEITTPRPETYNLESSYRAPTKVETLPPISGKLNYGDRCTLARIPPVLVRRK